MDIKMGLVMDLAKEYHCQVLKERCQKCDAPLVRFGDQEFAFCIIDIVKNEYAQQDRKLLDSLLRFQKMSKPTEDTKVYIREPGDWRPLFRV